MRHSDWENRLSALIEEYRHKPFAWGECDCLRFANDAHWAVAGNGFADDWDAVPRSSTSEAVRAIGGMGKPTRFLAGTLLRSENETLIIRAPIEKILAHRLP